MNIQKLLLDSIEAKLQIARDPQQIELIERMGNALVSALKEGRKILVAGNGGSAADAQHFVAELAGKFAAPNRQPLPAIALTTNSSIITAIGNDFGYEEVFSRQVAGLGVPGDVFISITTSGNSQNILLALQAARGLRMTTLGLLGNGGGKAKPLCDLPFIVPSSNTQHIQEAHGTLVHILCGMVDEVFARI